MKKLILAVSILATSSFANAETIIVDCINTDPVACPAVYSPVLCHLGTVQFEGSNQCDAMQSLKQIACSLQRDKSQVELNTAGIECILSVQY